MPIRSPKRAFCHTSSVRHSHEVCTLSRFGGIDRTLFGLLQQHTVDDVSRRLHFGHPYDEEKCSHLCPPDPALSACDRCSIPRLRSSVSGPNFRSVACGRHCRSSHINVFETERTIIFQSTTKVGEVSSVSRGSREYGVKELDPGEI